MNQPQPIADKITLLALYDPITAYGILSGIPRVPISINTVASFTNFATNAVPLRQGTDTTIAYRTWLSNVCYSVNPIGQFQGNIFQSQYASFLRSATGVSVRCQVQAGPKYLVSEEFTPLENFANMFASDWFSGWTIYKQQNILTELILTAVPGGSATNLTSYAVTITWNGWQFIDPSLDEMDPADAECWLREAGLFIPPCAKGRKRGGAG